MKRTNAPSLNSVVAGLIRERRMALGISQENLADRCGVDRTYISAIERELKNVSLGTLERIVGGLDLGLAEFVRLMLTAMRKDG
jgi:transcriptional regulator with XRE-family HTH domain